MNYRERLAPSPALIVLAVLLSASFGLILVPLSTQLAIGVAVTLGTVAAAVVLLTSPIVSVENNTLKAGRAQIEGSYLKNVRELTRDEVRTFLGKDVRAFACHRDFTAGAVVVDIDDPRDPTPYWIISTNEPELLAAAIRGIEGKDASSSPREPQLD